MVNKMETITVGKIIIQGIKGILKPVEFSLGKASKPGSLAIYAPNACGKSGIADALEYFFDEKGEIEHLGIRSDSEKGGKPAIPHIYSKQSRINPEITLFFYGGQFSSCTGVLTQVYHRPRISPYYVYIFIFLWGLHIFSFTLFEGNGL